MKWIIAYFAAALAFGMLDFFWLRWAADNLYRPVIGSIMAEQFRMGAAAAFYVIYIAGMVWFAVKPGIESGSVATAAFNGALLGALCYATFDLTSQAVMKVWATHISIADIAWGTFATAVASGVAAWAAMRLT
ncbi:MAG: DUF2177 family protein [Erythrobacter sp.]|nr:MAG: DUF2177 family protein [Erythrobacter sp.]